PTPCDCSDLYENRHKPLSRTTTSPGRRVWKIASPSPVNHINMVSSSPGNTGELNRPSIDLNLDGSDPHNVWSSARPVKPYVQRPCRIGVSKPAACAKAGSECNGLRSPDSR